jgi:hypothetical protein
MLVSIDNILLLKILLPFMFNIELYFPLQIFESSFTSLGCPISLAMPGLHYSCGYGFALLIVRPSACSHWLCGVLSEGLPPQSHYNCEIYGEVIHLTRGDDVCLCPPRTQPCRACLLHGALR